MKVLNLQILNNKKKKFNPHNNFKNLIRQFEARAIWKEKILVQNLFN